MNSNLPSASDPAKQPPKSYNNTSTPGQGLNSTYGAKQSSTMQSTPLATSQQPNGVISTSTTTNQYSSGNPGYGSVGVGGMSQQQAQYSSGIPQEYTSYTQQSQTTQYGSPSYATTTTTREYGATGGASTFQPYGQMAQYNQANTTHQQQQYGGALEQQYSQAIQQYGTSYSGNMRHTTEQEAMIQRGVSQVRVVGHEYGQERVISIQQRVDESRTQIVGERYVEHEVRVPKKIIREDIIEKVVVIPERRLNEEIIEEVAKVKEKIIEIARPVIVEKIIEVPEYEYVERIVEYPEKILQEKQVMKEVVRFEDRIIDRPVPQYVDDIIEVPEIQYRDVPQTVVVEVPEYQEEIIWNEVRVPQYRDKPVPQFVEKEVAIDIDREIPIPVEANVTYEYRLPKIKPRYNKITYPVYLPRFVEIPVAVELLNAGLIAQAETHLRHIGLLPKTVASLCEIENLATTIMKADHTSQISSGDLQAAVLKAWQEGTLQIAGSTTQGGYVTNTTTTTTVQSAASPVQVFSN